MYAGWTYGTRERCDHERLAVPVALVITAFSRSIPRYARPAPKGPAATRPPRALRLGELCDDRRLRALCHLQATPLPCQAIRNGYRGAHRRASNRVTE